jgi:protein SCO1/2
VALLLPLMLAACHHHEKLSAQGDLGVQGTMPPLAFRLTDVETGKPVTAADFHGKVVMLYFGYTNCPNVCPMTLYDATKIFHALGPLVQHVRFLFVTVDPRRDTPKLLAKYVALYNSPDIIGLRGTPAAINRAASRYHSSYSVHPSPDPAKYTVTHTAAVYVFGPDGKAQFINAGLSTKDPDLKGMTDDLRHLIERSRQHGIMSWLSRL